MSIDIQVCYIGYGNRDFDNELDAEMPWSDDGLPNLSHAYAKAHSYGHRVIAQLLLRVFHADACSKKTRQDLRNSTNRGLCGSAYAKGITVTWHLARPGVFQSDQSVAKTQKAHEPKFVGFSIILGRPCGIRTCDQRIKSPLLYQLS